MKESESRVVCFIPTKVESVGVVRKAGRLLLVRTGVGKDQAVATAAHVYESYRVDEVLVAGFGGGTRLDVEAKDLVACDEVIGLCEGRDPPPRVSSSPALLRRALDSGMVSMVAPAVTVDHIAASSAEKMALGEKHGAAIVEMEGFPLLDESKRREIPGLMVRVVMDPVDEDLSHWTQLFAESKEPRRKAWIIHLAAHPTQMGSFMRLVKRALTCRRILKRFLERYL